VHVNRDVPFGPLKGTNIHVYPEGNTFFELLFVFPDKEKTYVSPSTARMILAIGNKLRANFQKP